MQTEERVQLARDYFRQGYNCSQSVVMAFQDLTGIDLEILETMSIGLGGGVGRMREVCGTVTGMAMVCGSLTGTRGASGNISPKGGESPGLSPMKTVRDRKQEVYAKVQDLAARFRAENGSVVCRELLGLGTADKLSPVPQERTGEYYKKRPCEDLVACAVRIIAENL